MPKKKLLPQIKCYNEEQKTAIATREGQYACRAFAGTGKTSVTVGRYASLISSGESPESILSLSFTAASAKEMRERAESLTGIDCSKSFVTFHSLALRFAEQERDFFPFELAPFPLIAKREMYKIAYGIAKNCPGVDGKELLHWISKQKRLGRHPEDVLKVATYATTYVLAQAYSEYEKACRKQGVLDFDDLILKMTELLLHNTEIHARWQYKWLQVDEAQDLDVSQWALIKLLSESHGNVFAVGDGNQSIYSFRGASPELFIQFQNTFANGKFLYLGENFRSSKQIVDFCKKVAPIKNELLEHVMTNQPNGPEIRITGYASDAVEAEGIVEEAKKLENVAILHRTNRGLRVFEDLLAESNTRYYLLGKSGFWHQPEVKNCVAYLQLARQPYDAAVIAAIRAPFQPSQFIRKKELIDALKAQQKNDPNEPSIWQLLNTYNSGNTQQRKAIDGFVQSVLSLHGKSTSGILHSIGALDHYDEDGEDNSPYENIQELIKISQKYPTIEEFLVHIRKVTNATRVKKGVCLSTIHGMKGKEAANVYVAGVTEGVIPHKKGDLDEEERLLFVSCSRPSRALNISYHGQPSRFLLPYIQKTETTVPELPQVPK